MTRRTLDQEIASRASRVLFALGRSPSQASRVESLVNDIQDLDAATFYICSLYRQQQLCVRQNQDKL
eukprot:6184182-Pleurochrysis_carterae.AAC.1